MPKRTRSGRCVVPYPSRGCARHQHCGIDWRCGSSRLSPGRCGAIPSADLPAGWGKWPYRGWAGVAVKPVTRWLLRKQIERLGKIAAAGTKVTESIPEIPPRKDRRRKSHRALADYAADWQTDRAAIAGMRYYPSAPGAIRPTRLGSALATMNERLERRHGLDLSVCWEPLLGVLPADARLG